MLYTTDPREVEAVRKVLTFDEVREAFWRAWCRVFAQPPSDLSLALLLAHSALETGRWKAGLWCFNFGNKKASLSYRGNHCYFRCNELINGKYVWFDPPHPQTRFRAFATAADGAESQVRFLGTSTNPAKPNRYQAAWNCLLAGDATGFCAALHRAGYFTAHLGPYQAGVTALFREYIPLCARYSAEAAHTLDPPHDDDTPEHSAVSQQDVAAAWIGEPRLGLPEDVYQGLQRLKQEDYSDD